MLLVLRSPIIWGYNIVGLGYPLSLAVPATHHSPQGEHRCRALAAGQGTRPAASPGEQGGISLGGYTRGLD